MCLAEDMCKKMLLMQQDQQGSGRQLAEGGCSAINKYPDGQEVTFYFWQDPLNASCLRVGKEFTDLFLQHMI